MATLSVLTFDPEGRPIQFDTWLDDLQLYLLSDSRDGVSLFDLTSGASLALPATEDSATRSQWLTRDVAARLAVRNHLPLAERAHFGQHKTAKAQYDAVVTRYSSPATAALGRLILPYLFPELSAFATVDDLITHLRTSNTRYCAALTTEFLDKNPPPMDHFLALDPTDLTVDLLEKHLLAVENSVVAVGAARGTPRTPFFEGCSPSPLAPTYASAAAVDILGTEDVRAASIPSRKRRSGKGKGGKSGGGGGGSGGGSGSFGGGGGGSGGSGGGGGGGSGSGGGGSGGGWGGAVERGGSGGVQRQQQQRLSKTPSPQSGVDIFALNYDALLAAMYALTFSVEGDCYLCVPPDPGIEAAALGASESALPGTAPGGALHTFTHDSGPVAAPCSCRLLSHQTLLWHHRLGHPSLPRLRGMHSRLLGSGLPTSLPPLLHSPAPPCLPYVEGRQRAAPHSSSFPPTIAPLQTLHMDVWGPARVSGQGRERYFLLSVSSSASGSARTFLSCICTLTEVRRIGLVMEVARTSMIHAAAPNFLWPFAVRYVAHQLNLWPRVSLPETSPTLRWTGKVVDASLFRIWSSRALVCDTSADKLSSRAIPCVFLGFPPHALGWQFYHPTSRRVLPSQDVMLDESVPFYRPSLVDPLTPQDLAPSGVSQVDPLPLAEPIEVTVESGAARGGVSTGAVSEGAEPASAERGGAEPASVEPRGAETEGAEPGGAESGGAEPRGTASAGGPAGALP
ncbi:unnamed protein product [Closterium sp. NIES-53]